MGNWRKRFLFWLVETGILFVLWIAYVDQFALGELLVGAGASVLAAAGSEAVRGLNFARFYPYAPLLLEFWRVPAELLKDCWLLATALVLREFLGRQLPEAMETVEFDAGGNDTRSATRRALATTFTTLTPNSIVIHIDEQQKLMLYHRIIGSGEPLIARKLGAKA